MTQTRSFPLHPWQAALLALLAEAVHLLWEQSQGGIRVHHLLQRDDWPGLSNAWGLIALPLLAAWVAFRLNRREANPASAAVAALLALACGAALATAFALDAKAQTELIFFATALAALALPAYRAECLLGWVLGMSWSFGALIPMLIGSLLAALSAGVHCLLLPGLRRLSVR